jgi:hypothetical protein
MMGLTEDMSVTASDSNVVRCISHFSAIRGRTNRVKSSIHPQTSVSSSYRVFGPCPDVPLIGLMRHRVIPYLFSKTIKEIPALLTGNEIVRCLFA